jgi:hypothetical protein
MPLYILLKDFCKYLVQDSFFQDIRPFTPRYVALFSPFAAYDSDPVFSVFWRLTASKFLFYIFPYSSSCFRYTVLSSAYVLSLSVTDCKWGSISHVNFRSARFCITQIVLKDIVQCWGYLITSDHQLSRVTPLKTPVGLLIPVLQPSPTRNYNHNYSLRRVTFTQLTIIHVRDYNHLLRSYTFTLADFSAINYWLKLSQTLHLHTSKLSPRTDSTNSLLKTAN